MDNERTDNRKLDKKNVGKGIIGFILLVLVVLGISEYVGNHNQISARHGRMVIDEEAAEDIVSEIEESETLAALPLETIPELVIISNSPNEEQLNKVRPVYASSTSELTPESNTIYYHAQNAIDGNIISSWQEGVAGNGEGQRLRIEFNEKTGLRYIKMYLGNWRDYQRYINNNRSKTMKIEAADNMFEVHFEDVMEPVWLDYGCEIQTQYIDFVLGDAYVGSFSDDTCISEIEFYK